MPGVGKKKSPYTALGQMAAKEESMLTGQPIMDARDRQEVTLGYGKNFGDMAIDPINPMTENALGQIEGKIYKK